METLFDDKAQRTVIRRKTAMDRGLPSIRVAATLVEVPGFKEEVCDRLYFIDAFKPKSKKPDVPISAWGVTAVAKNSPAHQSRSCCGPASTGRLSNPKKTSRNHQGQLSCSWAKTTPDGSPRTA
jgi:hypothetical protein